MSVEVATSAKLTGSQLVNRFARERIEAEADLNRLRAAHGDAMAEGLPDRVESLRGDLAAARARFSAASEDYESAKARHRKDLKAEFDAEIAKILEEVEAMQVERDAYGKRLEKLSKPLSAALEELDRSGAAILEKLKTLSQLQADERFADVVEVQSLSFEVPHDVFTSSELSPRRTMAYFKAHLAKQSEVWGFRAHADPVSVPSIGDYIAGGSGTIERVKACIGKPKASK